MAWLKFYVISCSSGNEKIDARSLYVWGEMNAVRWLPDSPREAKRRIQQCKIKTGCKACDAKIHHISVQRENPNLDQTE